eukprot:6622571-Heterocapsa_arctica.AAC.1
MAPMTMYSSFTFVFVHAQLLDNDVDVGVCARACIRAGAQSAQASASALPSAFSWATVHDHMTHGHVTYPSAK